MEFDVTETREVSSIT